MNNRLNKICVNGSTYWVILLLSYSACSALCNNVSPVILYPLAVITRTVIVMRLVDFLIGAVARMPVKFFTQPWDLFDLKFGVFFVWACCHSRWKSSGCWSSQSTKRHNFQTVGRVFWAKIWLLSWHTQPLPRSPCILHQGLSWINNAFVLGVRSEKRESNRLELWCGISKQLLHEWQSQGLLIWTWENPGGAGGEETAAAAEPLCIALCGVRQPSL